MRPGSGISLENKQVPYNILRGVPLAAALVIAGTLSLASCSMLGPVYVKSGYRSNSTNTIRRARLVVYEPSEKPELAELISAIVTDTLKAKTGYNITAKTISRRVEEERCKDDQGAFFFSVEELEISGRHIILYIRGKLIRCSNSETIWRAEGRYDGEPGDKRLKDLGRQYKREYGEIAEIFTEPLYYLLKDIINTLPDPEPLTLKN